MVFDRGKVVRWVGAVRCVCEHGAGASAASEWIRGPDRDMTNVFVYGSLMFDAVWDRLIEQRYEARPATLPGYRRHGLRHVDYPAIVASSRSTVSGIVYLDVTAADLAVLDGFEAPHYQRTALPVRLSDGSECAAVAYVLRDGYRHLLSVEPWDPAAFEAEALRGFLERHWG